MIESCCLRRLGCTRLLAEITFGKQLNDLRQLITCNMGSHGARWDQRAELQRKAQRGKGRHARVARRVGTRSTWGNRWSRVIALLGALERAFVESSFLKRFRDCGDVARWYIRPERQLVHREEAQLAWRSDAFALKNCRNGISFTRLGIGTALQELGDRAVENPGGDACRFH